MKEIANVLAFVNRQMILIFKTNDLLRNIESSLGTANSMGSFIQMSKSCISVLQVREAAIFFILYIFLNLIIVPLRPGGGSRAIKK